MHEWAVATVASQCERAPTRIVILQLLDERLHRLDLRRHLSARSKRGGRSGDWRWRQVWIRLDRFNRFDLTPDSSGHCEIAPIIGRTRWKDYAYVGLTLPGLVFGVTQVTGADIIAIFGTGLIFPLALAGSFLGLFIWATSPLKAMTNIADHPLTRVAEETSFISIWVIIAYLSYSYAETFGGFDLQAAFGTIGVLLPLIAVLVGFVPGCGPQVLVATLYLNGVLPFAALIGNAISNDGDALFPAIALNPRAALIATGYSALPALVVAYGFYSLAPGFMN